MGPLPYIALKFLLKAKSQIWRNEKRKQYSVLTFTIEWQDFRLLLVLLLLPIAYWSGLTLLLLRPIHGVAWIPLPHIPPAIAPRTFSLENKCPCPWILLQRLYKFISASIRRRVHIRSAARSINASDSNRSRPHLKTFIHCHRQLWGTGTRAPSAFKNQCLNSSLFKARGANFSAIFNPGPSMQCNGGCKMHSNQAKGVNSGGRIWKTTMWHYTTLYNQQEYH